MHRAVYPSVLAFCGLTACAKSEAPEVRADPARTVSTASPGKSAEPAVSATPSAASASASASSLADIVASMDGGLMAPMDGGGIGLGGLGSLGSFGHGSGTGTGGSRTSIGGRPSSGGVRMAEKAVTSGPGLPPEVIRRIVRSRFGQLRACYEKLRTKDPAAEGSIKMEFTIGRAGDVISATVDGTPKDADFQGCLLKAVRAFSFPEPEKVPVIKVVYPVEFKYETPDASK